MPSALGLLTVCSNGASARPEEGPVTTTMPAQVSGGYGGRDTGEEGVATGQLGVVVVVKGGLRPASRYQVYCPGFPG